MSNDRSSTGAVTRRGPDAAGRMAAFARWRTERPFWGSALAIVAGLEIYSAAAAPISVMAMQGLPGLLTIIVALVAVIMGAVTLFQPIQRVITGWIILVLGPISILATNLGGFVIGMILLVVGGALILSWHPTSDAAGATAAAATTGGTGTDATAVHSPLVADPDHTRAEDRAVERESSYTEPVHAGSDYAEASTEHVGYGATVDDEPEQATRNPWRTRPVAAEPVEDEPAQPVEPSHSEPASTEPAHTEPAYTEPAYTEPAYTEPAHTEPVRSPVAAEPAVVEPAVLEPTVEPAARPASEPGYGHAAEPAEETGESEVTRNPWRSRTPPPETPGNSSTTTFGDQGDHQMRGEKQDAGTRSWFSGATPLSPMEPPKSLVRTTLLIPVILLSLAASGLIAAPAAQAQTSALPCLIAVLCPEATPTPSAAPSAAPSATPSSGLTLPTLPDLNLIPGTGDDKPADDTSAADKSALEKAAAAAACPTDGPLLPGTTAGGDAAIDGAAAIDACKTAGITAQATAADSADPQNVSGLLSTMKASRLEMSGFKYNGVKTLNTAKGPLKALSFSVDTLKIDDYDHMYPNSSGETSLKNGPQAVLKGNVRLYVTSMTGKIYGLLNLTFTPDFAPPLVLPSMFFTETTSKVVFVSADSIALPGFGLEMK